MVRGDVRQRLNIAFFGIKKEVGEYTSLVLKKRFKHER